MQQAGQVYNGERDYMNIKGENGPMYYPAVHAYIYVAALYCKYIF